MVEKRRGRPSLPEDQKRQQIGVRVSPELKAELEAVAASNGRSVAQEAELRLLQSFADGFDPTTTALLRDIGKEIMQVQKATKGRWFKSVKTWGAVAAALERGAFVRAKPDFAADDEALADAWDHYVEADTEHSQIIAELDKLGFVASKDEAVNALLGAARLQPQRGMFGNRSGLGGLLGAGVAPDDNTWPGWLPFRQREHELLTQSPDYAENREELLALHTKLAEADAKRGAARAAWSELYGHYVRDELEGRKWYLDYRKRLAEQRREAGQPFNLRDLF